MKKNRKKLVYLRPLDLLIWVVVGCITVLFLHSDEKCITGVKKYTVSVNDSLCGMYDIHVDTMIVVDGAVGVVGIRCEDSVVTISKTSCRKRVCTHQKVNGSGGRIVCLPNRVVIKAVESEGAVDFIVQ